MSEKEKRVFKSSLWIERMVWAKGEYRQKKYSIKEGKQGKRRRGKSKKMEGGMVKGRRDEPPFFT